MDFRPILAASLGIALYRGVVAPLIEQYLVWRNGPRVQVARRNWRGVYVPDLHVKRGERVFWLLFLAFVAFGAWVDWRIMVSSEANTSLSSRPSKSQGVIPKPVAGEERSGTRLY